MALFKETAYLRMFGLLKVPMIFLVNPTVEILSSEKIDVRIPLTWRTKNHLRSMYFGVLAIGADVAGGLLAMKLIDDSKQNISLVFKDFKADFLKRPEADVHFVCTDGKKIKTLVNKAIKSGQRENETVKVTAYCPKKLGKEPVARFELTLSLKKK